MMQVLFLVSLHLWGLLFALNWRDSLPIPLIAASGFLWGVLAWVLVGVIDFILPLPFSLYSAQMGAVVLAVSGLGLLLWHIRRGNWRLSISEAGWCMGTVVLVGAVAAWATTNNYTIASPDSWELLLAGRSFGQNGIIPANDDILLSRGIFVSLFQSNSILTGMPYDSAGFPVMALSGGLTFAALVYAILRQYALDQPTARMLAGLLPLLFLSAGGVGLHIYYIHANLTAGWYLTLSLGLYWLWLQQGDEQVLLLGTIALVGYSFTRSEAPIFSLFILSFLIAVGGVSPRQARLYLFPQMLLTAVFLFSQLFITLAADDSKLEPTFIYVILAGYIALLVGSQLTQQPFIQRWILPHAHWLIPLILFMGLVIVWDEGHLISIQNILRTLFTSDLWGISWVLVLLFTLFSLSLPPLKKGVFYWGLFLSYLLMLLILVTFRRHYRIGWGDSANRMLIHMLPSIYLYLTIKLSYSLTLTETARREMVTRIPRWGLLVGGLLLLLYGLYLWSRSSMPLPVTQ